MGYIITKSAAWALKAQQDEGFEEELLGGVYVLLYDENVISTHPTWSRAAKAWFKDVLHIDTGPWYGLVSGRCLPDNFGEEFEITPTVALYKDYGAADLKVFLTWTPSTGLWVVLGECMRPTREYRHLTIWQAIKRFFRA